MRDASVSGQHPVSRRATFAQSDIHSCKPPIEQERPRPNQGRLTRCRIHPYTPGMRSLKTVIDLEDGPRGQTSLALASSCIGNESVPIQLAQCWYPGQAISSKKGKGSPYSITERRVPELIPVLGSQPAGDVSHKPGGRLPLLSAKPAVPSQHIRGLLPILLLSE